MTKPTLLDRIFAALDKLHGLGAIKNYPIDIDETGEPMFVCHSCGEIGHFPDGNGGITHHIECATQIVHRLKRRPEQLGFFDQLVYKSLLHQIAHLERYPQKQRAGYTDWQHFCPFCQRFLEVTKETHQDGRGITTTYTMPHAENCIVTLAKAELEQQGGEV